MQFVLASLLVLVAAPVAVFACEGECIIAITNAFLGNYSTPIHAVLNEIVSRISLVFYSTTNRHPQANQISTKITHSQTSPSLKYLTPLVDAYNKAAYSALETAIFPSYFHGKCQNEDGTEPEGCPNPDCPVVCGTPGSLVHFYGKLKSIVYEETSKMLVTLASPGSESYNAVEKAVVADADPGGHRRRMVGRYGRAGVPITKRADGAQAKLKEIMKEMASLLEKACGENQVACSWEGIMKSYILSFP